MDVNEIMELFDDILPQKTTLNKPHKAIALLAVIEGIEAGEITSNKILHGSFYKQMFSEYFEKYKRVSDSKRPHTPFFHLKSNEFWTLIPHAGKESDIEKASTAGGPGKLDEVVAYAELRDDLYLSLKEETTRNAVKDFLISKLEENTSDRHLPAKNKIHYEQVRESESNIGNVSEKKPPPIKSKFPHEQKALEQVFAALENHVELIPNFDLYDNSTSQYLECDLIVVSTVCTAIVELKHWAGEIEIRSYEWLRGPDQIPWTDPHRSTKYKKEVLRGFCRKKLPFIPKDYPFQPIVLLTNPDATVHNYDGANTEKKAPTFDSIATFAKYFKRRLGQPNPALTVAQAKQIADRLRNEAHSPRRKGLRIPGHEILENLTESPHLIELLAKPTSNQLQTVKRLRIFSVDPTLGQEEREAQRTKSRNSLKALTRISDHPNILKVWDIHHEDGLIIEASDWSRKEGTLANVIKKNGPFPLEAALPIIQGIAKGLEAVHHEGIVHRNLTPENIMMFGNTPKLMNFDLSYLPEDERLTVLPDDLQLKESPYLAPELYHHQPFAEATDIFSLGVIAYELLTGAPPFPKSTDLITDKSIYDTVESKLTEIGIPESLRTDIVLMIQRHREDRPQEIGELQLELKDIAEETRQEPDRILKPGEIFGVYTIQEWIGKGRDAQVYQALQGSDNWVAMKLFHQDAALDRVFAERDALKSVSNPYIVGYETFNQLEDGRHYLILDLVSGDLMRQWIDNSIRPELVHFQHVAACLMEAVATLHDDPMRQTIILHNDIKPDNILIKPDDTPVLIDFGASGAPSVGPYMGTDAYVAPDLFQGAEFEFCESGDLFALGVTLFEWLCGVSPYSGTPATTATPRSAALYRKDIPEALSRWFQKAVQPFRDARFQHIDEMRGAFTSVFSEGETIQPAPQTAEPAAATTAFHPETPPAAERAADAASDFLDYLNQLHNTTADNRNALAEAQARSRFFGSIHVSWPITDLVWEKLTAPDGENMILTGHAGDGKSTIGLEIFKRLEGIPMSDPLDSGLDDHIEKTLDGQTIHLVKDMSELGDDKAKSCIMRAAQGDGRWLIISNTGRLMEILEGVAPNYGLTDIQIGNLLLGLLQEKEPARFNDLGAPFALINLSQLDNLQIVRKLFHRFIDNPHWDECRSCDIYGHCPVQMNLNAIRECRDTTSNRVAWVYRLLYEYGKRLTLRQVSAHLAYSLTAGLDCGRIREMAESPTPPPVNAYLFYNRFFGFRGASMDEKAQRLKAVQCLMPMEMGARPFLSVDRVLWTFEEGPIPELPGTLKPVFESLREMTLSGYGSEAAGARFRQEFRRLFFMSGAFSEAGTEKEFVGGFTGSPMLVETESWQASPTQLTARRREELKQKVLHVLLEQYTGFYIPETRRGNELFITLNRRSDALRQSVQILLADISFSNFELVLEGIYQTFRPQRYVLVLRDRYSPEIRLTLDLPFLDFVLMRSEGELGQRLKRGYLDRLDYFKNLLLRRLEGESIGADDSAGELRLIQLNNDGNLEQYRVMISDGLLEIL